MKILVSIIFVVLVSAITIDAVNSRDYVSLTLDKTTVCVPKEYVPELSPFGQYLQDNVSGLDESGQSEIIRLPAKLIMAGVEGYKFSHINKHNVDLEHTINGIAHNLSNVGKPDTSLICDDEYDLGHCHQSIIYKDIYFQYSLKTDEQANKEKVQKHLYSLFELWEHNCEING